MKQAMLPPDDSFKNYSPELLKDLHILTRDGKVNQDSRRKLKQIEHLGHLCFEQMLKKSLKANEAFIWCDVGAGKNYLSFLLWDRYIRNTEHQDLVHIWAIETRTELNQKSQQLAEKIGLKNFHCITSTATDAAAQLPKKIHALMALHACDTATDDAIKIGLDTNTDSMILVPCCQAELAQKLNELPHSHPAYPIWRQPLHRREFGSHLTNVIRNLFLESRGYKTRSTEFIGLEHTLKNELITAEKVQSQNNLAQKSLEELLKTFPLEPYLLKICS